jgi:hypothetical protein
MEEERGVGNCTIPQSNFLGPSKASSAELDNTCT